MDVTQLSLSKEEKRYINLFGDYYEKRGLPHAMGQIYSVLAYKAQTPEEGMTQRDIAQLVDRSVSAVSRLLNSLVEMGLGLYTEKVNERGIRNTTQIMVNLTNGVKRKIENAILDAEDELGSDNTKVIKAWERFDKGLIKIDECKYSKAIEEFYKAYWAL